MKTRKLTLREKQSVFLRNVARLITWAFGQGYELTGGELLRTDEQQALYRRAGKSRVVRSLHQDKLAVDLLLFVKGKYISDSARYAPLGRYWCSLDPANRWGGDWDRDGETADELFPDGNHFEMMP